MYLTRKPINVHDVILSEAASQTRLRGGSAGPPRDDGQEHKAGASVLFFGLVRDHSKGKTVRYLEYEAYEEMSERMLSGLVDSAFQKWPLQEIKMIHRLGQVELGEIAVAIEVRSAHRNEAYQASRYLIEEIKHKAPIWKKEYFEDGTSEWAFCQPVIATEIC